MPLSFDPQSLMAPGGVVHGLNNLGSAVIDALNRRAERRYLAEAAAKRGDVEESRFTRQLQSNADLQASAQAGQMERTKVTERAETGRKLLGEGASTVRNFASNATDLLQTGMTAFSKVLSGKDSTSKDGLAAEKELNDSIIAINDQARKEYPDVQPDAYDRLISGNDTVYDAKIAKMAKDNEAKREAFKLIRGKEHGLEYSNGRFVRATVAPAGPTPKPAVAAQADSATAGSQNNAAPNAEKEANWKEAEAHGWRRAEFDADWYKDTGN